MKNLLTRTLLLGLLTVALAASTYTDLSAQCSRGPDGKLINLDGTPCVNTVLTALPFLRITPDARSSGMGDVGIGLSPDPNAMHFNPSKLAFMDEKFAMSATYTPWLRALGLNDVYLAYLTGAYKIDDLQTLGMGLRYFSLGSIQFTDVNGENLNVGRPNEFEVSVAYARKLSEKFSASVSGKFIYSNLAAGQQLEGGEQIEAAVAGAADIAFTYRTPIKTDDIDSDLTIGLAATNIGNKVSYTRSLDRDFLPANLGIGAAWDIKLDEFNTLTVAADVNKLMVPTPCVVEGCDLDANGRPAYRDYSPIRGIITSFSDAPEGFNEEMRELMFSFGLEYWYAKQFAVRAGYYSEHNRKGGRKFFTAGLGLKYNIFGINFSYLVPTTNQRNPLDNTLRFSLLFDFSDMDNN